MTPRPREIPDGTRCIIYARVSKPQQAAAEKVSLAEQLSACRKLAAELGYADLFVVEDKGRSAFKEKGRIESLVAWCETHKGPGHVICYTHSRFARIAGDEALSWLVVLRRAGWALRFVDSPITGNVTVDAMNNLLKFSMAHEESVEKQKRSRFGGRGAAEHGRWNGGPPPFGYRIGPTKVLITGDSVDVKRVREAFKLYATGGTLDAVARVLGFPHASSARAVLANPVYIGTIVWGRRKGSEARGAKEHAHAAIVDRAIWTKVQDRLRSPNRQFAHGKGSTPKDALPYILSGLARCTCALGPTWAEQRARLLDDPELRKLCGGGGMPADATKAERARWRSYQCKRCRGSVRQAALESGVLDAIAQFLKRDLRSGHLGRRLDRWIAAQLGAVGDGGAAKRADLETRIVRWRARYEKGDDAAGARIDELMHELTTLDAVREERPSEAALQRQAAEMLAHRRQVLQTLEQQLDPRAVNTVLATYRPIIQEVLWDRDARKVHVFLGAGWENVLAVSTTVQARSRRQTHTSGSNAPWRGQA